MKKNGMNVILRKKEMMRKCKLRRRNMMKIIKKINSKMKIK